MKRMSAAVGLLALALLVMTGCHHGYATYGFNYSAGYFGGCDRPVYCAPPHARGCRY